LKHCGNPGNDAADELAKEVVSPTKTHRFRNLVSAHKKEDREKIPNEWRLEWQSTEKGTHLRVIDFGLPSKHAQRLYGSFPRNRAYVMAQLRTGHSWLSTPKTKDSRMRVDVNAEPKRQGKDPKQGPAAGEPL